MIEEIRVPRGGRWDFRFSSTILGVVDLADVVLPLAAVFFSGFPVAALGNPVSFGTVLSGLAIFMVAVI